MDNYPDQQHEQRHRGFSHFFYAFRWSMQGLVATCRTESSFRQELFFCLLLAPAALLLGETGTERALLTGTLLLVLIVELINSSIESMINRIGTDYHEFSRRAKDQGSAAVFLCLVLTVAVWGLILWPKFMAWFGQS